jgi:hypothetical protein
MRNHKLGFARSEVALSKGEPFVLPDYAEHAKSRRPIYSTAVCELLNNLGRYAVAAQDYSRKFKGRTNPLGFWQSTVGF